MELEVSVEVAASPAVVWEVLTDWEAQSDWMVDAKAVTVVSAERAGRGTTIRVPTNLLGITVTDIMRVTDWQERRRLEVEHLGKVITGSGAFELEELGPDRTRVTWLEWIDPPFGALGEWGAATFVRPITERLFRRSLRNLAELAESRAVG